MALRQATDPTEQRTLKDNLPACTISGLFASRSADSLTTATHLICIDIDAKDNTHIPDFDTLKEQIKACPYVLFCGLSARGKGYFCIIQIADHSKFLGHFLCLERDFRRAGIVIDNSCKNINRLRYASYDPEPYINLDAVAYDRIVEAPKRAIQAAVSGDQIRNAYRLGALTTLLNEQGKDITEQYQDWFLIACAITNEFKEAGRPMFHELSKNYVGYTSSRTDLEYDKALRHQYENISFEAIFRKYFPKNGIE